LLDSVSGFSLNGGTRHFRMKELSLLIPGVPGRDHRDARLVVKVGDPADDQWFVRLARLGHHEVITCA